MKTIFSLKKMIEDIKLTISMLTDFVKGNYKEIPLDTLSALIITIAYVISPIDFVTDVIPVVGWIDDLVLVRFFLIYAKKDIKNYVLWKSKQETTIA